MCFKFDNFWFLFSCKSNTDFNGICKKITETLEDARKEMKRMPTDEVFALRDYAAQRSSEGSRIWVEAELQRRDFLLKQWSMLVALLAFFISVLALLVGK